MSLNPLFTKSFNRDVKRCRKRGKDMDKLQIILDRLIEECPLPDKNREHSLQGNWAGHLECHIESDWLLIYRIEPPEILFERTGSHSDLFD